MSEINENLPRISCSLCGQQWQVLNEDGTDWDEVATAAQYNNVNHRCINEGDK